jgi:outer membrane receptor protein involved in Fe transport
LQQVGVTNFFTTPTIRQTQYGGWISDTVQLARRFTVDVGVRYEVYTPLEPSNTGAAAFFEPTTNTFNYASLSISMRPWRTDTDSVAPRIGVSVRATNKTVVRAGYSRGSR